VPAASKRTSTDPPAGTSTVCGSVLANCIRSGSSDSIVTVAGPPVFSWFVMTAPNDALSPTARNRGNVGLSVIGLLMRISLSADPKRDPLSPATAMMR
jgi:hypothetical protein